MSSESNVRFIQKSSNNKAERVVFVGTFFSEYLKVFNWHCSSIALIGGLGGPSA